MSSTGKTVGFEYTLKLDDGTVVESNVGRDTLEFVSGQGQILPKLEEALVELKVDDTASVTLAPKDAYGPVNQEAFREVPIEQIPEPARKVGTQLKADGFNGTIRVHEVKTESVVLDFNHPLAGETLTFDVRVLAVS